MKKYLCLFVCILLCCLSACSISGDIFDGESKYREVIASEKYYCIYKGNGTQVYYNIYDSKGKIVLSEKTDRPLKINMVNNDIVVIQIGMGSGITTYKYYDVKQDAFSQVFSYVLSNFDELVAYIDITKGMPFENRKIVVQNIFDKDIFYKEFQLDFSNVDTPVIEATFLEDGTSLCLTYLSGDEQTPISTVLSLDKTGDGSLSSGELTDSIRGRFSD